MPTADSLLRLDLYSRNKVELWRVAAVGLVDNHADSNPLVQAGLHAVVAWLRYDAHDPMTLLELFGRPHGPLGPQLRLLGSLLDDPRPSDLGAIPPFWWEVVKAAYFARWLELTQTGSTAK